jgi:enediyne biosynthesis protein E4
VVILPPTPGGTQLQMVRSGSSYCSSSDLALTFGLGNDATASAIEIQWPSGTKQKLTNVAANQHLSVKEP